MEVRTTIHPTRGSFDVEITNVTRPEQKYKYMDVPMSYPFTYLYPVSYVTNPVSMGIIPKTDDCVTLKHEFFRTDPAYPDWIGYYCFSRLPNVFCHTGCQIVGMRWEKVEFVW